MIVAYMLELPEVEQQDAKDALRAGGFLLDHITKYLVPDDGTIDSIEKLQLLTLRDRVGAMLLLKIVMLFAIQARRQGFLDACAVAGHIYSFIGVSTGLEPTMNTEELLQQLKEMEN
jgi:hypothetical protein